MGISFTMTSFYVIFRFPNLIHTVQKQGGSQVVLSRLAYHRRLTKYRVSIHACLTSIMTITYEAVRF